MIDLDVVAERDDTSWSHLYFAQFLTRLGEGLAPNCNADFREIFGAFLRKAQAGYHDRKIGPRALAPILLLMKFGLLLMDFDIDPKAKRHVLIVVCQAVEGELVRTEGQITDRACLAALNAACFRPLMPVWKTLIEYCYAAYKEPLQHVISQSVSLDAWQNAIRDLWPFLYLYKIAPTHDVGHADRQIIPNPEDYGKTPATYTNEIRTPRPLYTRLFGPAEIRIHLEETKMIDEVYAHLFATLVMIGLFGDRYFEIERAQTLAEAKAKGRMAGRQRVLRLHSHELKIPSFFAEQLISELRVMPA